MVYSDTTDKQGIIQDITFLLGVDLNNYAIADRTRNVNQRFFMVWQMIFESYGGWKFMDDNTSDTSTGVPYADINITASTPLYALPSGALTVDGVEIKTNSASAFMRLLPLTQEEYLRMGGDGHFTTSGVPLYYILQGDIIRPIPIPNFTLSSAMRVYFGAGISAFTASDTTKVPGFASPFHRMLSIGAALDYALARGLSDKVVYLQNLWNDYEVRLKKFYSKRFFDRFPHRINGGTDLMFEFT